MISSLVSIYLLVTGQSGEPDVQNEGMELTVLKGISLES